MTTYHDKTIAITGGASGIGLALAKQFGREGACVIIGEPDQARLEAAQKLLADENIDVRICRLDVRAADDMEQFADFAWAQTGAVHLLINNAGIGLPPKRMVNVDLSDLRHLFDVNLFGVWHGTASFGRRMIAQGLPAAIYNVGSENSFFNAAPHMAAYIASKHAVRGLTEAMREEFPDFMTIGMICPGLVYSEMTATSLGTQAMDTDVFAEKVAHQIRLGEFYIVTHGYNIERIKPVHAEIENAYAAHAPRTENDAQYDVRLIIEKMQATSQS